AWGLRDAGKVAATYGAELGFDWHLMNAHHSLGLAVGTLLDSNLDSHAFQSSTDRALILHGSAYLKYVF
ncbi:MAG TPA: hypothetical protein VHM19_07900, partial [Polyangiales bacterium]|nr:hypothetical protein [Polyangiales bacterium]